MIGTRWVVPILAISFCFESSSVISRECILATFFNASLSAGLLVPRLTESQRATIAFMPLSAKTVPMPPRPACLYLVRLRLASYQVKLRHPIKVCFAPVPADTTEILRGFPLAKWCVNRADSSYASSGKPELSSSWIFWSTPSTRITNSWDVLP